MDDLDIISTNIRWQDIVDIVLISYILFRLYIVFRGTNVFRVLIGIVILWFFQKIAFSLGLIVTSWSIQGFTAVAALIIVVIFRNEIRSVLQAKNFGALLWGFPHKGTEAPVDAIVESAFDMAKRGEGALIVIPGKEDIYETVHSGMQWDGLVSKEMITSIFWHDNPVHDGAAIVQGDRVVQVGAILPLSRRKDFPSYYGTRHRAAAGLAESTDALVVAISEERKDIVAAKGGQIHRINRKGDLSELLNNHLGIHPEQPQYKKKEKMELATAAIISLLFIAGIWFSFTRGADTFITREASLEFSNRTPGMEILDTSEKSVLLDLSGSGTLLNNIGAGQIRVTIDLSEGSIGQNIFSITEKNLSLPPGVVLRNVKPASVEVTLDKLIKKSLPVQVDWVGKLSEELSISDVRIEPKEVLVIGGSLILKDIFTIYTEPVPLDTINKSGKMIVKAVLSQPSLRFDSSSKEVVTIEYTVAKKDHASSND